MMGFFRKTSIDFAADSCMCAGLEEKCKRKNNWSTTNPQIPNWFNLCFKCRSDSLTPSGRSTVTQRYAKPRNNSTIVTITIHCIVCVVGFFFFCTLHIDTLRSSTKHSENIQSSCRSLPKNNLFQGPCGKKKEVK